MTRIYSVPQSKFALGELYVTAAADEALVPEDIQTALRRHAQGDWGEVCAEDREQNNTALRQGGGFHSVYHDGSGVTFWIITEWDRSVTTVLLPDDY